MKKIAHFVERFPVAGNGYIYEQVLNNSNIKSLLITEWLTKSTDTFNVVPLYYYRKYSRFSSLNRLNEKLNDGILNKIHIRKFNAYAQKILEESRVSIMHAHFGTEGYKLIDLRRKLNIPLMVTFYGVDASYCLRQKRWIDRYRELFKFADSLIVLCEEVRDRFLHLGCPKEKIKIWDIGIDTSEFGYRKREPKDKVKFLTVGRFVEKKGYFVLLRAFRKVLDMHNNVILTIIGYGPLKRKILSEMERLKIDNFVTLIDTTKIDNFNQLFKDALSDHDIFVLPSIIAGNGDDEGGPPVVITNAQSCGIPVISTPVGGITRVIKDNETGFLCRSNDVDDLACRMSFSIENSQLWNSIGEKARSFIETNSSLPEQLKKLEQFYLSIG